MTIRWLNRGKQRLWQISLLAAPCLAAAPLWSQEPPVRSVQDDRLRIEDERLRPRYPERQSHRGWEVRTDELVVFATTSREDAHAAAEAAQGAWQKFAAFAESWTPPQHQPNAALGSVQVFINGETPRDADQPYTPVQFARRQTQVEVRVNDEQPLEEQLPLLQAGIVHAYLHTYDLDRQLPDWVREGLAAHFAGQTEPSASDADPAIAPPQLQAASPADLRGDRWRLQRALPNLLEPEDETERPAEAANGTLLVRYLLTGDDGRHAPQFLEALADTLEEAQAWHGEGQAFARERAPARQGATPADELAGELQADFLAWQEHPLRGQPILEPNPQASPELEQQQREMIVVLKLSARLQDSSEPGAVRPRFTSFQNGAAAPVEAAAFRRPAALSGADLLARLNRQSAAWATLDANGELLLSSDEERVAEALGADEQRYRVATREGRAVWSTRLETGRTLYGWLEENPQDRTRPLAKFAVQ